MSYEIAGLTHCKHCNMEFVGPSIVVIGQPAQHGRLAAYLQKLHEHIETAHPAEYRNAVINTAAYRGLEVMMHYRTTDKELRDQRDKLRWAIHQATLNARISDAALKRKTAELTTELIQLLYPQPGNDVSNVEQSTGERYAIAHDKIMAVITWLRDELEEPGKYGMSNPAAVPIPKNAPKMTH